jgi:hypothetical protein
LADAARFVALLRPFRQARPHWDFADELLLKAAETRKRRDVEAATAQMEGALRVVGSATRRGEQPSPPQQVGETRRQRRSDCFALGVGFYGAAPGQHSNRFFTF